MGEDRVGRGVAAGGMAVEVGAARRGTETPFQHVLGDFSDVTFEHGGQETRVFRDAGRYLIETDGPDGKRRVYEVVGVGGVDPLQQYLLSPEPGRVQA